MKLPEQIKSIRTRYIQRFPVPQGEPGEAFEERARQWSIAFAEQVAFEQGALWGMKRADPNRPISKDTIALYADDGIIRIWDLLIGTGTGRPRLAEDPDAQDLRDQVFVPVTPTNHLAADAPVPQDPPRPDAPPAADTARMEALEQRMLALEGLLAAQATVLFGLRDAIVGAATDQKQAAEARHAEIVVQLATLIDRPEPAPLPRAWTGRLGVNVRLTPEF